MSNNSGVDKGLLALIQGVLGTRPSTPPEFELTRDDPPAAEQSAVAPNPGESESPVAEAVAAKEPDPVPPSRGGGRKTAGELAAIILKALQTLDGAPASGFAVTVYGGNPWNAMLTIKPQAGPIADPGLWHARVREMAARLRQDFDLIEN